MEFSQAGWWSKLWEKCGGPCLEDRLAAFWREMGQGYRAVAGAGCPTGDQTERVDSGLVGQNGG